jgi:nucleotide-binding universal stress UspA family protein
VALKKILVPVDFSDCSVAALKAAINIARSFDAKILALHVIHDPADAPGFYASQKAGKKVFRNMEDSATQMMEEFAGKRLRKYEKHECYVRPGIPATQILQFAQKQKVDMIAMGTHGRGGLDRLMLGSVADRVIRSSDCPVLIVRDGQKAAKDQDGGDAAQDD